MCPLIGVPLYRVSKKQNSNLACHCAACMPSVYARHFFIIIKIRLLAVERHVFHHYKEQLSKYESDNIFLSKSHISTAAPN